MSRAMVSRGAVFLLALILMAGPAAGLPAVDEPSDGWWQQTVDRLLARVPGAEELWGWSSADSSGESGLSPLPTAPNDDGGSQQSADPDTGNTYPGLDPDG